MSNKIPKRSEVPASDKWNLSSIYKSNEQWEEELKKLPSLTEKVTAFKGKLGESPETLLAALKALEAAELQLKTTAKQQTVTDGQ